MGATYVDTPRALAKQVDYLFLMVGYPRDLETLIFDKETGIINDMKENAYLIDHTTSSPGLAERIATELLSAKNVHCLDAPVSGGDIGAQNGALVTMVGGDTEAVEHCRPLMDIYSS